MRTYSNPYDPSLDDSGHPSRSLLEFRKQLALTAFLPGSVVGLNLGAAIQDGVAATINRSTGDVAAALQSFVMWSIFSIAMTLPWRICRGLFLAYHSPVAPTSFVSAILGTTAFYLIAERIDDWQLFMTQSTSTRRVVIVVVALTIASATVEVEAMFEKIRNSRDNRKPK